ncbi:uncharacterized protein LOC100367492 [Saccoglossus kowalevskii]|uniref:Interferon-induced GTP-binding protein Mx-like n=1 Tax=Saccoglossus kowalevskii TaxID=10224 RepID=A0ABM0H1E2_SACKO|nr:PREDICTED: interferon-induced GTP-binding protein Mx-like [Saccoglossus kowalevskii]
MATDSKIPTLAASYQERIRPCIDLVDSLRRIGLDKDVDLPAVVVIGDQSVGKSSVLEAISGVQLPRGNEIVTRCPIELRLKTLDNDEWCCKILYTDYSKEQVNKYIDSPGGLAAAIRKAQEEITNSQKGISKTSITVEIQSSHVPNLTLIDLPGIARVPQEGQSRNIADETKDLIKKYISKDDAIVLCVIPCNVDIATTEAIKMAQEADPTGSRTLGVLTKPDLVDKGSENVVVRIAENKVINLKKGYTIMKCRSQRNLEDSMSLEKAMDEEERFFREHKHYSVLSSQAGSRLLAHRLTTELVEQIMKSVPQIQHAIKDKLEDTKQQLTTLGEEVPMKDVQRIDLLVRLLDRFPDDFKNAAEGVYKNATYDRSMRLQTIVMKLYDTFADELESLQPSIQTVTVRKPILDRRMVSQNTSHNGSREKKISLIAKPGMPSSSKRSPILSPDVDEWESLNSDDIVGYQEFVPPPKSESKFSFFRRRKTSPHRQHIDKQGSGFKESSDGSDYYSPREKVLSHPEPEDPMDDSDEEYETLLCEEQSYMGANASNVPCSVSPAPTSSEEGTSRDTINWHSQLGDEHLAEIKEELVEQRGLELPPFAKDKIICDNLIRQTLKQFIPPAERLLQSVNMEVERIGQRLVRDTYSQFPRLQATVMSKFCDLQTNAVAKSKKAIDDKFKMEDMIHTRDRIYKDTEKRMLHSMSAQAQPTTGDSRPGISNSPPDNNLDSRSRDYDEDYQANKILRALQVYLKVATTRLMDDIPLMITFYLLQELGNDIKVEMAKFLIERNIDEFLREDAAVEERRLSLEAKKERLDRASRELAMFSTI